MNNILYLLALSAVLLPGPPKPAITGQQGEEVRIDARGIAPITGELLSADHRYLVVLFNEVSARSIGQNRSQPTIVYVYYEIIDRLRVGINTFRARDLGTGVEYPRLRQYSRYPQGISQDEIEQIMEEYEQEDLYEIRSRL
ncbi:MAG: hypothetical protein WD266_00705 [Balneolales bacterium]